MNFDLEQWAQETLLGGGGGGGGLFLRAKYEFATPNTIPRPQLSEIVFWTKLRALIVIMGRRGYHEISLYDNLQYFLPFGFQ